MTLKPVTVRFNGRQLELIDHLDGLYGETRAEKVRTIVAFFLDRGRVQWTPDRIKEIDNHDVH